MSCSRCQSLQLRFSNLRPCSTESAQREKTEKAHVSIGPICLVILLFLGAIVSLPVHIEYKLAGLPVSTLWMTFASTVNT